jgi:ribosomal protein S18 acetylase RimI-like enzyme
VSESGTDYLRIAREHLNGIVRLCGIEEYPSYSQDAERTWRALTAPGVCTMVAVEDGRVVGFAQLQSDGLIQAHLSLVVIDRDRRRRCIGRRLIREALIRAGGQRIDLLSTEGADDFYSSFVHQCFQGFRIHPERKPEPDP